MPTADGSRELDILGDEGLLDPGQQPIDAAPLEENEPEARAPRSRLPWIGALENPRWVSIAVLNEGGYLVPVLTAGDLLRGCKYFWHRS